MVLRSKLFQRPAIGQCLTESRCFMQKYGKNLGMTQKCIARIEDTLQVAKFDQIVRCITALGYRVLIENSVPEINNLGTDAGSVRSFQHASTINACSTQFLCLLRLFRLASMHKQLFFR